MKKHQKKIKKNALFDMKNILYLSFDYHLF